MNTQITQKLAQQIVDTVKDVCGQNINFIDCNGIIIASTDDKRIGTFHEIGLKAASTKQMIEVAENSNFLGTQIGLNLPIFYNHSVVAVIGITGQPAHIRKYARLAERITHLLIREKELASFSRSQEEKRNYITQALLSQEKMQPGYLDTLLNEFHVDKRKNKRILLIQLSSRYHFSNLPMIEQKVYQFFSSAQIKLFTFEYPNRYLAIIEDDIFSQKELFIKHFSSEQKQLLSIAVGKSVSLYQLFQSFDSALTALKSIEVSNYSYVLFDTLTLEIITSSLNTNAKEAYREKTLSALSEDDISLISAYYEENMSLQSTCQKLFIHKNTLQNRLDRIYEKSGYNPRKFRDAALLYLALKL